MSASTLAMIHPFQPMITEPATGDMLFIVSKQPVAEPRIGGSGHSAPSDALWGL